MNLFRNTKSQGFTIVELLIVVVVIAILATITVVAYNSVIGNSGEAAAKSDLKAFSSELELERMASGVYPSDLGAVGADMNADSYTLDYVAGINNYCLAASVNNNPELSFYISSESGTVREGSCDDYDPSSAGVASIDCPDGFIPVPGDSRFDTSDFCVMKYEAKNGGSNTPVSTASGLPWDSINQNNARTYSQNACDGCHLITEPEWMTIAANVLSVPENWNTGTVGTGYIYNGHVNSNPGSALAASTDDSDGFFGMTGGTGYGPQYNNPRTLTLTNGEVIWDLAGNVREWTDATIQGGQPGSSTGFSWQEYPGISNWRDFPETSRPATAGVGSYSSVHGVGRIYASAGDTTTRGFIRGGHWYPTNGTGVLSLNLAFEPAGAYTGLGFRVAK